MNSHSAKTDKIYQLAKAKAEKRESGGDTERKVHKHKHRIRLFTRYLHIYLNLFTQLLTIFECDEMSLDLFVRSFSFTLFTM